LELPKILWKKLSEKSAFEARASTRRFDEYADISLAVRSGFPSLSLPEADASSSWMKGM